MTSLSSNIAETEYSTYPYRVCQPVWVVALMLVLVVRPKGGTGVDHYDLSRR